MNKNTSEVDNPDIWIDYPYPYSQGIKDHYTRSLIERDHVDPFVAVLAVEDLRADYGTLDHLSRQKFIGVAGRIKKEVQAGIYTNSIEQLMNWGMDEATASYFYHKGTWARNEALKWKDKQ